MDGAFPQLHYRVENQHAHHHPDAGKGVLHPRHVGKVGDEPRQGCDDHQAGEHHAQRGEDAAPDAPLLLTDEGGGVDGDDAGGALADGEIVRQLLVGGPALVLHHLTL